MPVHSSTTIAASGGTHGAVNSQQVRNDCARQSGTEPTQSHEGRAHTLMVDSPSAGRTGSRRPRRR